MLALYLIPGEDENGPIKYYRSEKSYRKLRGVYKTVMIINLYRLLLYGIGIAWLLMLPVDDVNGTMYIDENALMPGYAADLYDGDQKVIQLSEQLNHVAWLVFNYCSVLCEFETVSNSLLFVINTISYMRCL